MAVSVIGVGSSQAFGSRRRSARGPCRLTGELYGGSSADGPRDALAAIELENMALVASIVVRSAEFRTESRAAHYRDDYPDRDDAHWFANVYACQDADGQMALTKEAIH